jgi:nicotinamidase-related amidase
MATAFALFDRDARVRVRADLCASSNGERVHAAALEMLGLTIGRDAIRAPHAAAPQADRWSRLEAVCRDAQAGRMRRSA